uniref:Uncharacterized protein n=2 Tax=Palpitomonas bilix TaxID=652834 RepID=A0A7S3G1T9_9EUKA|mmetsp:Transcript_18532/g.46636  ORF Transcript_18532/g.46636 Transcript_18532/m.46636 type:complete len:368 (+) Transcript_18532:1084-2187(+)
MIYGLAGIVAVGVLALLPLLCGLFGVCAKSGCCYWTAFFFMALYYFVFIVLFVVVWSLQQPLRDSCPYLLSPNATISAAEPYLNNMMGGGSGGGSTPSTADYAKAAGECLVADEASIFFVYGFDPKTIVNAAQSQVDFGAILAQVNAIAAQQPALRQQIDDLDTSVTSFTLETFGYNQTLVDAGLAQVSVWAGTTYTLTNISSFSASGAQQQQVKDSLVLAKDLKSIYDSNYPSLVTYTNQAVTDGTAATTSVEDLPSVVNTIWGNMNNTLDVVLGHVVNAGNCVWLKSVYFPPMDEACFLFTNTFFYFAYGLGVIVIASLFNFFIWGKAAKRLVRERPGETAKAKEQLVMKQQENLLTMDEGTFRL